jgi:hypothetical protein
MGRAPLAPVKVTKAAATSQVDSRPWLNFKSAAFTWHGTWSWLWKAPELAPAKIAAAARALIAQLGLFAEEGTDLDTPAEVHSAPGSARLGDLLACPGC